MISYHLLTGSCEAIMVDLDIHAWGAGSPMISQSAGPALLNVPDKSLLPTTDGMCFEVRWGKLLHHLCHSHHYCQRSNGLKAFDRGTSLNHGGLHVAMPQAGIAVFWCSCLLPAHERRSSTWGYEGWPGWWWRPVCSLRFDTRSLRSRLCRVFLFLKSS